MSGVVHVKVEGRGSFQNSPALKKFTLEMLERGHRNFIVDLDNCPMIDSTFMGTLAGLALRLREHSEGSLLVRNVNDRNSDLLRNLGLHNLFTIEPKVAGTGGETPVRTAPLNPGEPLDQSEHATYIIEAHEALVDAAPENLARFKDVLEYLKQDLRAGSK
jgi:anti-anti-sigma factor